MNKKSVWLTLVLCLGIVLFGGLTYKFYKDATGDYQREQHQALREDAEAHKPVALPDWSFTDRQQERITPSQLTAKVNVLNFWATWCQFCVQEMPEFMEVYEEYKDNPDVQFFFVNTAEQSAQPEKKVELFLTEHGLEKLPVYFDKGGNFYGQLGLQGLPDTLLLNAKGEALPLGVTTAGKPFYLHVGALSGEGLRNYIEEALKR